jgi:hypothetical protein
MELRDFQKILEDFKNADTDIKIDMYVNTDGLTQQQYKELLRLFPMDELYRLEEALA